MTGVTIEVKDDKGAVVEVKPVDLVKGETVASFTFTKTLTEDPTGVWTVAGIKVDLDLKENLENVYSNVNQVELLAALNKLGLTNVNSDNIAFYSNAITKLKNSLDEENYIALEDFTKADAQAAVAEGNKAALEAGDVKTQVKAVNDATNQVALLKALAPFERVNADWITDYDTALVARNYGENATGFKNIQTIINNTNASKLASEVSGAINTSIVKKDLNDAKTLISAYQKPDGEGETAKAESLRQIDRQLAIVSALEAQTPAQLSVAINKLKSVDAAFELNMENFKDENRQAYIDALKSAADGSKNTITGINQILSNVNTTQSNKPFDKIKTADTKEKFLSALKGWSEVKNVSDANETNYSANKNEIVVVTSTGDITKFDYSSAKTSFVINGKTINLTSNTTSIGNLVTAISSQLPTRVTVSNSGDKLIFKSQNNIVFANTATGDAAADLKIAEGTYTGSKASVQAVIDAANLAAVKTFTTTTTEDANKLVAALNTLSDNGKAIKDITINNKDEYNKLAFNGASDVPAVQLLVDNGNIAAVKAQTTAAGVLAKLQAIGQLKNVKAENAKAYFDDVKNLGTGQIQTGTTTLSALQTAITNINTAEAATTGVKAVNNATTATQMRDILTQLVVDGDITAPQYLNLTNADKLKAAE